MKDLVHKNLNVPNLRFPEFSGEWERKKLGEVAEKINSGKTPLGGEAVYTNKGVLFIRSQNVNNDRLELDNSVFISEEINKGMKNSIVFPNDILLNITGASLGRSCVAPSDFKTGNVNQHVCIIRPNKKYNPRFIQPILSSTKGQNIFQSLQTGSGREGLNFENIKNIEIYFPSLEEQGKISSFLSVIDERIQTQKKTISQLESLMQSLREMLFKQWIKFKDENGDDFPDWKVKKLGEVLSIPEKIKPKQIEKDKLLTVKLHMKGVLRNENTDSLSIGSTNYYIRKKGQFIYGKQNLFNGAFGIIPDEFDGFLSSGDVPALDIDSTKLSSVFLFNFFGRETFYKKLEDIASGSGSKRIHEETLFKVEIQLPCLEEQIKIANVLSVIDEKIKAEIAVLNLLTKQKQYLLQQLFI